MCYTERIFHLSVVLTLNFCLTVALLPFFSYRWGGQPLQCIWTITNGPTNGGFKLFEMV
ncbi:hypothetical protein L208DRAFT_1401225 [Tricholoma matsutake]|nr:hypothetical protein L208DRAFT_1401225 [Tricholoma matsutake 945]